MHFFRCCYPLNIMYQSLSQVYFNRNFDAIQWLNSLALTPLLEECMHSKCVLCFLKRRVKKCVFVCILRCCDCVFCLQCCMELNPFHITLPPTPWAGASSVPRGSHISTAWNQKLSFTGTSNHPSTLLLNTRLSVVSFLVYARESGSWAVRESG